MNTTLYFLKLGGSLITDKTKPQTPRLDVMTRLAAEIAAARDERPTLQLILGHGSGSFGHIPAKKHHTRQGVHTQAQWKGFLEVWHAAAALNQLVIQTCSQAGLPVIGFPPSAMVSTREGKITSWDLTPLTNALTAGLIPVVYGDVVFDHDRGGTILSTEDLFGYLALKLQPERILLAGIETGVWADYPQCKRIFPKITPQNYPELVKSLAGSNATDVTGGMESKVQQSLEWTKQIPALKTMIFSGIEADTVFTALLGDEVGTLIAADELN